MNRNIKTIVATAMLALATGCVTAGTWVNGYYIDGPLCTVCDGMRVVQHAYGTTVCTHCDGTGIEPPEEPVVIENVVYANRCPPPPPPIHHHRPTVHRNPPHHGGVRQVARPASTRQVGGGHKMGGVRLGTPRGGGGHGGGGHNARR